MKKILIVDDDKFILEFLAELFKTIGHQVLTAENAEDGLEIFKQQNEEIDVVLTDAAMPEETDGLELVQQIRNLGFKRKIVMMSGTITESMATSVGADQFLEKPFPPQKILEAIQN